MPIVVRLNPVAPLIGAAQNVGNFATGQEQQQAALQFQAANRQAQQQAFSQDLQNREFADRQAQGAEDLQYKYDLLDQNNQYRNNTLQNRTDLQQMRGDQGVELQNLRNLASTGNLDQRGQQRLADILAQGDVNRQRDQARFDFQGGQGDLNRALGQNRIDATNRNADMQNGLGYDRLDSQQQIADANRQGRMDQAQYNTDQQQQRRSNEQDIRLGGQDVRAQISELSRQRTILEARANRGDPDAGAQINAINGRIQTLLNQPRQQFVMPQNFQSGADVFAQGQAAPPPQQSRAPVPIGSELEYQALPPGTAYIAPDGSTRVKS